LEVLDAFSRLPSKFHLTIITKIDMLKESDLAMIQSNKNIELKDFKLSSSQMQQEYASHQILLHLSSDDSSPLAVMEAMKGGECIISTKIYAITEMVTDGMNGFLTNPKYQYFRDDLSVDKRLEKRKMHYLNNSPVNKQISDFIVEKLTYLDFQRKQLCEMRLASYREATKGKFSKKAIADKWGKIFGI
jgi:glycosyltransferase involved in cell wall biosynthesis